MKITCDCGNEMEFKSSEYKDDDSYTSKDMGQYTKYENDKFSLWSQHGDEKGIRCNKCKKAIWFY